MNAKQVEFVEKIVVLETLRLMGLLHTCHRVNYSTSAEAGGASSATSACLIG